MIVDICAGCRAALDGLTDDKGQAEKVEKSFPHCKCEEFSVGFGSPGAVSPQEYLYRMVISPGDVDQNGNVLITSLDQARTKGLSLFRDGASNDDIAALIVDRLSRKPDQPPRTVQALIQIKTEVVRSLKQAGHGRLFCVYDETVPRKFDASLPPVPTHVTLLQRLIPAGEDGRKEKNKKIQELLFKEAAKNLVSVEDFRDGLIADLNKRSLAGEFLIKKEAA